MKDIILFGNGDLAEVIAYYLESDSEYRVKAFTIDGKYIKEDSFLKRDIIAFEDVEKFYQPDKYKMFVALGYAKMNKIREKKVDEAKAKGFQLISYIHPKSNICPELNIGENSFIFENNVIQPFVKIGANNILWSGNHIGHHSVIGDNNFIASHVVISGRVNIENNCFIGVNATIRDNVTIASETLIGASALVMSSTKEQEVYRSLKTKPARIKSPQL